MVNFNSCLWLNFKLASVWQTIQSNLSTEMLNLQGHKKPPMIYLAPKVGWKGLDLEVFIYVVFVFCFVLFLNNTTKPNIVIGIGKPI